MTDHEPLDELASAYLDGVATSEETTRVAADPELLRRVEALRSVRAALAVVHPINEQHREQAIAKALGAFDRPVEPTITPTLSLTAPTDRRRPSPRAWRILGAAAVVAVVAVLVPLLASLSSPSDGVPTATEAVQDRVSAGEVTDPAAANPDLGVTTTLASPTPLSYSSLGSFEDEAELIAAIVDLAGNEAGAVAPTEAGPDRSTCVAQILASLAPGERPELTATATVADAPVVVVVTATDVRIASEDCTRVRIRPR